MDSDENLFINFKWPYFFKWIEIENIVSLKSYFTQTITLSDYHLIAELMENATFCCLFHGNYIVYFAR
jgi:hypothetical protein